MTYYTVAHVTQRLRPSPCDTRQERHSMYNWDVQNAIVAFVDTLKPSWPAQRELYYSVLYGFADMQSHLLTLLGYPPVA
ncbi:hypothetical protein [Rhodococcus tibetensis]|uniref:Uncharacterized protein n=1 Tax=Rhodococcus tibetensis TaxID=2965064 RepID=A0ABT1QCC6_9NOCA|nr:hypothetical protein [Rhodococcus sp. FXJ9.536]MCQ4119934.1 hypothetical protein [Rhodococcus sp. FXJ9.536]